MRGGVAGFAFRAIDSSNETSRYGLRVDDKVIYYFHGGAIIRRLK
ncbi:MAG: hypothetical protein ACXWLR_08255 [Myxococcales bacterium]